MTEFNESQPQTGAISCKVFLTLPWVMDALRLDPSHWGKKVRVSLLENHM